MQTRCLTVLKNRTGPAPDLWPRSMMMQKAFYDGWVDAAARAAGLPPPAAGCLGMKFEYIPGLGGFQSGGCTAGSKYVDGF